MSLVVGKALAQRNLATFFLFELHRVVEDAIACRLRLKYPTVCQRLTHELIAQHESENFLMVSTRQTGKTLACLISIVSQLVKFIHADDLKVCLYLN